MSLVQRSVISAIWNTATSPAKVFVLFVRSILLAQLLPIDVFGVYALASSIVSLSVVVPNFGMAGAFLYRTDEIQDEGQTSAIHFTLKLIFTLVWAIIMVGGTLIFASGPVYTALLLIISTTAGTQLTQTPRLILNRRVVHRRLAIIDFLDAVLTTLIALGLAWRGATLWALLSTNIISFILPVIMLYIWRPVWQPRVIWLPAGMRYFLRFGSRSFLAALLSQALDRIDDLWTGFYLGETSLGLYSRAYAFATYPREVLTKPVHMVALGTYAELKGNRPLLSQAFFRSNAMLVRSGFLIAGLLTLIAPEFIRLLLGEKWLPMLNTFRLMLVFTMLDPIKSTVSKLFAAVGEPGRVVKIRLVQLVVLATGLFLLGPSFGITGVALSVNAMLVVGMAILFYQVRRYVDFSLKRLFATPSLALLTGLVLTQGILVFWDIHASDWLTGIIKFLIFSTIYGSIMFLVEGRQFAELFSFLTNRVFDKVKS